MSIVYDLFAGDHSGGPVDYTRPVLAGVTGLSAALPALPAPSTTRLAVRARDAVTGLTERNTDAAVAVRVGPDGSDRSALPMPPVGLRALPGPGGTAVLEWSYPYGPGVPAPRGFRAYLGPAGAPRYGAPAAARPSAPSAVPWRAATFRLPLTGLSPASSPYGVAVRAWNEAGEEANAAVVTLTLPPAPPAPVQALAAAATR